MSKYIARDAQSRTVIKPDDFVFTANGKIGVFGGVTRGPEYNGTAKVLVDGYESYARVWGLIVEVVED